MSNVIRCCHCQFDISIPVVVIGAGAAGLIAGLAAHGNGAQVLIVERDANPSGSTALSSGLIPACNTRWQAASKVADNVETFSRDIRNKNKGEALLIANDYRRFNYEAFFIRKRIIIG